MNELKSTYLTETDLKSQVPSIFSESAREGLTSKYSMIPTIECVRALKSAGFYPVKAKQTKVRDKGILPYAKHMIRFRSENNMGLNKIGDFIPEIVLINSHNGLCSYQLKAGIFRLVCSNGLVVGKESYGRKIRHKGDVAKQVVDCSNEIIEVFPEIISKAEAWKSIELNNYQKSNYCQAAKYIRWQEKSVGIELSRLLESRRTEDTKTDLWTLYNVVQENLMRGGVKYYSTRRNTTRAINSIDEDIRINSELWNLTAATAERIKR